MRKKERKNRKGVRQLVLRKCYQRVEEKNKREGKERKGKSDTR